MVLDGFRKVGDFFIVPLAKMFINVDPNVLSIISFLFAVMAGVSFMLSKALALPNSLWNIPLVIVVGSLFVVVSGIFDLLDGKVARMAKKESKRGDFLDHVFDRYSDMIIIVGLTLSGYCIIPLGLLALGSILMASYMGTQSQALGLGRDYKGSMGRADRIFLLIFFPLLHLGVFFFLKDGNLLFFIDEGTVPFLDYIHNNFTLLDMLMLIFIIGGNQTAIQRAIIIWHELSAQEHEKGQDSKVVESGRTADVETVEPTTAGKKAKASRSTQRAKAGKASRSHNKDAKRE